MVEVIPIPGRRFSDLRESFPVYQERANVFEPDVLTPWQVATGNPNWSGERKLLLGVLEDAVKIAIGSSPTTPDALAEARGWIKNQTSRVMGFDFCCAAAGLDPGWIRTQVERKIADGKVPNRWMWKHANGRSGRHAGMR